MRTVEGLRRLPWLLLVLAGCHGISVDSTHDDKFDFSKLHTFGWHSVPPQARTAVDDQSLADLLRAELERRGLKLTRESPDVLVAIHRSLEGSLNTKGWGYEISGGRVQHYELQSGTLVIDLVDSSSHKCVWRSTAEGAFKADEDPTLRQQRLADLLREMFDGFPPGR
jgi:hypothetical protein